MWRQTSGAQLAVVDFTMGEPVLSTKASRPSLVGKLKMSQ